MKRFSRNICMTAVLALLLLSACGNAALQRYESFSQQLQEQDTLSFTAALTAAKVVEEELGVKMELPEKVTCTFFEENQQCLRRACPYNPDYRGR